MIKIIEWKCWNRKGNKPNRSGNVIRALLPFIIMQPRKHLEPLCLAWTLPFFKFWVFIYSYGRICDFFFRLVFDEHDIYVSYFFYAIFYCRWHRVIRDLIFDHNVSVTKIPSAHAVICHFWFSFSNVQWSFSKQVTILCWQYFAETEAW